MTSPPLIGIAHPRLAMLRPLLEAQGWRAATLWNTPLPELTEMRALIQLGEHKLPNTTLEALPNLGLIAHIAAGYDGVDVPWCKARGIAITHAPGINADDVADLALGLLIAAWRNIPAGDHHVRSGAWRPENPLPAARSLRGRTLGIVGLGAIGHAAATRAAAFGLNIAWWGPSPKPSPWPRANTLLELAQASDILLVACRSDASNAGLISAQIIEAVGPKGLIINVSRGAVIDENALIDALKHGRLGQAALDVFTEEPTPAERWAEIPNTLLTPHIAGATSDVIPKLAAQAIGNVARYLNGEELTGKL